MTSVPTRATALAVVIALGLSACGSADEDTAVATTTIAADTETETDETDTETGTDESDSAATTSGTANTADVVAAADALIATLSDDEVDTLMYDFGDSDITSLWSNLPACAGDNAVERAGIQHGDLTDDQVTAVLNLAATILSEEGFTEYSQIILADDYLQDAFGNTIWDSGCYYMAIYGTPSESEPFAIQFGGHHVARMVTYDGDVATITPSFTGIEPGTFEVDGTTYDVMGDEMTSMFSIFNSLSDDQRSAAELDGSFDSVLLGPGSDTPFPDATGLAVSELSETEQEAVLTAIRTWVEDFDASVADTAMATIEAELDETYIGWATATDTDTAGAYTRIDGPSVWIETSNQDGISGIHYHSIYRDKTDDYGDAS